MDLLDNCIPLFVRIPCSIEHSETIPNRFQSILRQDLPMALGLKFTKYRFFFRKLLHYFKLTTSNLECFICTHNPLRTQRAKLVYNSNYYHNVLSFFNWSNYHFSLPPHLALRSLERTENRFPPPSGALSRRTQCGIARTNILPRFRWTFPPNPSCALDVAGRATIRRWLATADRKNTM